jgi:hypothetical protein
MPLCALTVPHFKSWSMAACGKNGAICYWAHWCRVSENCTNCGWLPEEGCHPERKLCATCFELIMDRTYAENPLWSYPACGAQQCRSKTKVQTMARSASMGLPSPDDAMDVVASPTKLLRLGPPPGLSSCGSIVSLDGTSRMRTPLCTPVGNEALIASMASLKQTVVKMTRKLDVIMVAIENLRWAMSVNPRFHSVYY